MSVRIMKNYVHVKFAFFVKSIGGIKDLTRLNSLASVFVYVKSLTKQCAQVG